MTEAIPAQRAAFLSRLRADWDDIAAAMTLAVLAAAPGGRRQVRRAVEQALGVFALVMAGEAVSGERLDALADLFASRLADGGDEDQLDAAVTAAMEEGIRRLCALVPESESATLTADVTVAVVRTHAAVLRVAADAASRARLYAARLDEERAASDVDHMLSGAPDAVSGRDGEAWLVAVLAAPAASTAVLRSCADRACAELPGVRAGRLRVDPVPHVPLLIEHGGGPGREAIGALAALTDAAAGSSRVVVVCEPCPHGAADAPAAYERLRRTVEFTVFPWPAGEPVSPAPLQLCRTIAAAPSKERMELVRLVIGPLLAADRADLLPFLDHLVASGSYDAIGDALGASRSTVKRKIGEVKEITGLDWQDGWGRLLLSAAVLCRWLAALTATVEFDAGTWGPVPQFRTGRRSRG